MKKTLILVIALVVCLATMLTLTACHECEWSGDWSADADTHFHKCTVEGCDKVSDQANHVYDQMVESADYLDVEATATTNATYFYSCVCGKKGTTTFEKQKPLAEVSIKDNWIGDFSREYDHENTYCSMYTFNNFPEGATLDVYYKPYGADDSEYQAQDEDVAEDAGKYVMKAVIGETVETAETIFYHEFEITKIYGTFSSTKLSYAYNGGTTYGQAFTNYLYGWVVDGYYFNARFITSTKGTGIFSTENGTLTVEVPNPNYVLSGSIEIVKAEIHGRITVEYEEDGIYDVKLGSSSGVKGDDEVYVRIDASYANTIGEHNVHRAATNVSGAVWVLGSHTGAEAKYYVLKDKMFYAGQYSLIFEIVAPTAE